MGGGGILLALLVGGAATAAGPIELLSTAGVDGVGLSRLEIALLVVAPLPAGLFLWRRWYRLGDRTRPPAPFSTPAGAAAFCGLYLAGMLGAVAAQRVSSEAWSSLSELTVPLAGQLAAQVIVLAVLVAVWRRSPWPVESAGGDRAAGSWDRIRPVVIGACAMLLYWPVVQSVAVAAQFLIEQTQGAPLEPIAHETLGMLHVAERDGWFFALTGLVIFAVPFMEEVLYRGILQPMLSRAGLGRWPAIVGTSMIFASVHLGVAQPHAVVAIFVLSLGFGWAYERTGRLAAPVSMHVVFNAGNVALTFLLPEAPG